MFISEQLFLVYTEYIWQTILDRPLLFKAKYVVSTRDVT